MRPKALVAVTGSLTVAVAMIGSLGHTSAIAQQPGIAATYVTPEMKRNPNLLRPYTAKYSGTLVPAGNLKRSIAGKTVVLRQPWIGLNRYQLKDTPVFFDSDGLAHSGVFSGVPWAIAGNRLCLSGRGAGACYEAFTDSTGQAYLLHRETNLLAQVAKIARGDSNGVIDAYKRYEAERLAKNAIKILFVGLLAEALISGAASGPAPSGGGSEIYPYQRDPKVGPPPTPPPAPAIGDLYRETPGHGK